jgi:ABC-type branched-subunit amino acid transport system substrate-binding protein
MEIQITGNTGLFRWRRCLHGLAVLSALLIATTACGTSSNPSGTNSANGTLTGSAYKIGVPCALSGPDANQDLPIVHGMETYAYYANHHGGINGHPVQILTDDSQADVATESADYKKELSEGALAIASCNSSAVAANVSYFNSNKVPVVSTSTVSSWYAPGANYSYIFSVSPSNEELAPLMVAYIKKALGANQGGGKVARLVDSIASAVALAQSWSQVGSGLSFSSTQSIPSTQTDYSSTATSVLGQHPIAMMTALTPVQQAPFDLALQNQGGWTQPWIGIFSAGDTDLKDAPSTYAALRYWETPTESAPSAKALYALALKAGYASSTDLESFWFSAGWVEAGAIITAMESCKGTCTSQGVDTGLENLNSNFLGITAQSRTTPTNHIILNSARVYAWDSSTSSAQPLSNFINLDPAPTSYTGKIAGQAS